GLDIIGHLSKSSLAISWNDHHFTPSHLVSRGFAPDLPADKGRLEGSSNGVAVQLSFRRRTRRMPSTTPVIGFRLERDKIACIGDGLQRPECILAERDGSVWSADARGGVVHLRPDGSQHLITQRATTKFSEAASDEERYTTGTLPNGLAFARNGA